MEGHQIGQTRTEQDAIVNAANDVSIVGITGWRVDVPGGRVITVQLSEPALYMCAFNLTLAALTLRLHRVKRIPDTQLQEELRNHAAALATQFVRCCYQQLRESAKVRYSTIVRDQMMTDLRIMRCNMPNVFARIIAGLGPIIVSEGHLKTTHLVPYLAPGNGDMHHDLTDQAHPWNEDIAQFMTTLTAFRINPEIRTSDVDFTNTQGSAFWTIWSATPDNVDRSTGFCTLPESYYTEVDKLLATIVREPTFAWPSSPIVPIDWSDHEVDRPAAWSQRPAGSVIYGVEVIAANLEFTGNRHFYMPAEIICARIYRRTDHVLRMVRPSPKQPRVTRSRVTRQGSKDQHHAGADSQGSVNADLDPLGDTATKAIVTTRKGKGKAVPPPTQPTEEPEQPVLHSIIIHKVRVGYAGFYGIAFDGATPSTSTQCFNKASALA